MGPKRDVSCSARHVLNILFRDICLPRFRFNLLSILRPDIISRTIQTGFQ